MVLADYSTPTASGGKAFCGFYIKNPPTLEEAGWSKNKLLPVLAEVRTLI